MAKGGAYDDRVVAAKRRAETANQQAEQSALIARKEAEAEQRVAELRTKTLEELAARQNAQIAEMQKQLDAGKARVDEVNRAAASYADKTFFLRSQYAAWREFTELERRGGIVSALDSGFLRDRLARTWAERSKRLATRADPITGVSEFPYLAEKPIEREPAPPTADTGLPRLRYAQAYEELRDRSDAHLAEHGERPAQEPLAHQPPPPRAARQLDRGSCVGVAHERAPATRMRGFSTEYSRSTARFTNTYPAAVTRTTPCSSV